MKQWILPIFLITLSIIVKPADCCEMILSDDPFIYPRDVLFNEEYLIDKIDDVQNDMDLINTNLPILRNTADSETNLLLDQRISLSFSQYLFNKTRNGIMSTVKSVEQTMRLLISKMDTLKVNFLKKLDETFQNVKEDVKIAIESIIDKSVSVVKCVTDQKSAFDSLVKKSITGAMDCVKDTIEESIKAIKEALSVSTEAKALVEDLSKQESECDNQSDVKLGFFKCLLGILRLTKTSVKLLLLKIKTSVRVAFKTFKEAPRKLISCQSTIKEDTSKIIQNIKQCTNNPVILLGRNLESDLESPEEFALDNYDEYDPPDLEEYDKDEEGEEDYHY